MSVWVGRVDVRCERGGRLFAAGFGAPGRVAWGQVYFGTCSINVGFDFVMRRGDFGFGYVYGKVGCLVWGVL